jgi:hypothetical protein
VTRNLSTAYHPQTDRLTERKNQWIEQYLRLFVANTQDDWDKWLTIATVVHNSWPNATTKVAPSQAMLGYLPDLTGTKIQTMNETISQRQEQAEQWRKRPKKHSTKQRIRYLQSNTRSEIMYGSRTKT